MKSKREQILLERRLQASEKAFHSLKPIAAKSGLVLSYSCIHSELSLSPINQWLCKRKSLVLPRVEGKTLQLYLVTQTTQLIKSALGILEPNPETSTKIDPCDIDTALIPGLAFDPNNHRLGYGKGHYDQLLSLCKSSINSIGVGFHEQFIKEALPSEGHDIPLKMLQLF